MGEVYLARQRSAFDREVAIKIIRSDLVHDMTARQRFRREAQVNAHIKHEHILSLYEFGEEQGRLFLVTPYVAGGTLAQRLHKGPLTLSEVHQLFTALVRAVAYIHRRGVVHRDLKPSNILLDQEEGTDERMDERMDERADGLKRVPTSAFGDRVYVRLIDFGIATIQGMSASPPLTTAGTEMGTVAYMAPERMSGVAAPSNDIFSLGIILHQMLTGKMPDDEPKATLPKPLAYVVNRSIAPQLDERFASAEELLEAFEEAYQSLSKADPAVGHIEAIDAGTDSHPLWERGNNRSLRRQRPERVEGAVSIGRMNGTGTATKSERKAASRVDTLSPAPKKPDAFIEEDYASPTVNLDRHSFNAQGGFDVDVDELAAAPPLVPLAPPNTPQVPGKKKRRNPILAIITLLIVLILFVMAGLFYFEFQTVIAPTATINFGPKVLAMQRVYHITAQPTLKTGNVATASIPAKSFNKDMMASSSAPTTGQNCPTPLPIGCQQSVQESDVYNIAIQLRQILKAKITTYLQQQVQKHNGTSIGAIQFIDVSVISNPTVGAISNTVAVSMTERGILNYYSPPDAQNMARQLLQQQVQKLGPNYVLLNSTVEIGQPAITGLNSSGIILSVAAGGDVQYQIPPAQLHAIAAQVKGMKRQDALAYIKQQPGIDPASVSIHLSTGDTMPGNVQQITIIPVNPTAIPLFNLPTVTPTGTSIATAAPATTGGNQ